MQGIKSFLCGQPGAIAVAGDWNGDGHSKVGYYLNGFWVLDYNDNGVYDGTGPGGDKFYAFGGGDPSYVPLIGDWNGDGRTKVGYYRNGFWALDTNGNGTFDGTGPGQDNFYGFGGNAGEIRLVGDWNGSGTSKIGIYVNGFWVLDFNGNGTYDGTGPGGDRFIPFGGASGYQPIIGRW